MTLSKSDRRPERSTSTLIGVVLRYLPFVLAAVAPHFLLTIVLIGAGWAITRDTIADDSWVVVAVLATAASLMAWYAFFTGTIHI